MSTLERPVDRGARIGRAGLVRIGQELREARLARGLTIRAAASAAGISPTELGRIERAAAPWVSYLTLARCAAVVGLDLSTRLFPGPRAFRDASQLTLLEELRLVVHPSLAWAREVPLPVVGDQRAWDATIAGPGWRFGVEAETAPRDLQEFSRRLHLKLRDGRLNGVLVLIRDTRLNRDLVRREADVLAEEFPVPGRRVLRDLAAGKPPSGSAIVLLRVPARPQRPGPHVVSPGCAAARGRTTRNTTQTPPCKGSRR